MTYKEAIEYLYDATPQFQRIGAAAYKPGLDTARRLSALNGDKHKKFPKIHVAGTNGKGSVSHTLAAVLQAAGYKVGLFTSPHLVDFRERIKIDGKLVTEVQVTDWLEKYIASRPADLNPSFFELTTVMAFDLFADSDVDIAVVEVGLGGRLDSTNIIDPILTVITNISKDHTAQLGDTLTAIAGEKAGIIKSGVPVVLGESDVPDVVEVITDKAIQVGAELIMADNPVRYAEAIVSDDPFGKILYRDTPFGDIEGELNGKYQLKNTSTVLASLQELLRLGWKISREAVAKGFSAVTEITGLAGRWQILSNTPLTVCDTGHNEGGWKILAEMLRDSGKSLFMVIGFVNDKDVRTILGLLPRNARYYFTKASVPRAMDPEELQKMAATIGLHGIVLPNVVEAVRQAQDDARKEQDSLVFIGGSTFVVADMINLQNKKD